MLTPRFKITQDSDSVSINIYAPFTNLSSTEIVVEDADFRFFSTPYYLRLHLPGRVRQGSGHYDADTNSFVIRTIKETPGENFEGLDMITKLLTPPNVKVIQSIDELDLNDELGKEEEDIELDWFYPQDVESQNEPETTDTLFDNGYGFGFNQNKVYSKLPFSGEILDIKDTDSRSRSERTSLRLKNEEFEFSADHYLCDLFEPPDEMTMLMKRDPYWSTLEKDFTDKEIEKLLDLPKKEFLLEQKKILPVYLGLLDILLAYSYDMRTTEDEHSAESGWTICKLSSTLVCSERFDNLSSCLIAFFRRSLVYPLYRSYELSLQVVQDVARLLKEPDNTVTLIIKILLDLRSILSEYDERYIFNQLYIDPYLVWLQRRAPNNLKSLGDSMVEILNKWSKQKIELDIPELESAAKLCQEEKIDNAKICNLMADVERLCLEKNVKTIDSDDEDSTSDSTSDSSSSEEESSSEESAISSEESTRSSSEVKNILH